MSGTILKSDPQDRLPVLGSLGCGGMDGYPGVRGGGVSHHNTYHGPMSRLPGFDLRGFDVAACRAIERSILRQEYKLIGARFLFAGGMLMTLHAGLIPHEMRALAHRYENISKNEVIGTALTGFVLSMGVGVYLAKLGASLIDSIKEGLRNDQVSFEMFDCGRTLAIDDAKRDVAARRTNHFEEVRIKERPEASASWGKTVALGAAAAAATVLAAAAIAEDFFPVAGGPANDAPAVIAAATSWRLYLACF